MILGIYHPAHGVGHDTGVALVDDDGRPMAAQSEERFSRVKMDGGFPFRALEALQHSTGFTPGDLAAVAVPFMGPGAQATEGARLLAASLRDPMIAWRQISGRLRGDFFQRGMAAIGAYDYLDDYKTRLRCVREDDRRPELADWQAFLEYAGLGDVPLARVDHHLAHAAGAYFTSDRDPCLVITCDGVGALKGGIVAVGREGRLRVVARTFYPHSPGEFWEVLTVICGFHHMKHGGKITGLAAHGRRDAPCYAVMRETLDGDGLTVRTRIDPVRLKAELAGVPREDIAATAQRRLEEVVSALVARAARRTGLRSIALAGGVFANVRLNQRIAELDGIDEVWVFPAMGDEGLAFGAAVWAAARHRVLRPYRLPDAYLGTAFGDEDMRRALAGEGLPAEPRSHDHLVANVAERLAAGRVVAVCRGRMEFGPRALGHRSILHQATDPTVNDWLNKRLKRTEFMPFAPITLADQADRCYVGLDACRYSAEYMTITCECTPWMREVSPAVVHLDGTARPQLVSRDRSPFYHDVVAEYHRRTGIPTLINTSFNMHEEPIVCTPTDAVRAYLQGHLDTLVLGPFLVDRASLPGAASGDHTP